LEAFSGTVGKELSFTGGTKPIACKLGVHLALGIGEPAQE
jgi:hypothetical protein